MSQSTTTNPARHKLRNRLIIVVLVVLVLFAALVGFNTFKGIMIGKFMQSMANPPQTVSTMAVQSLTWQPKLEAFGNVRAVRGADLAFDVPGLVAEVEVASGADVKQGQVLIRLVDDQDRAALDALRATAQLAALTARRARQQLAVKAISQAGHDAAAADAKNASAQAEAQAALVARKTLRAPFAGRIGIITASPGQYANGGEAMVTLQQLDPVYVDFHLAQASLANLHVGNAVKVSAEGVSSQVFDGKVTAIDPRIDTATRNIRVEAILANPDQLLVPGMFTHVAVANGKPRQYLTLPTTAITYAPYGDTVFVVHEGEPPGRDAEGQPGQAKAATRGSQKGASGDGKPGTSPSGDAKAGPQHYVEQVLVELGSTRGDQVAVVSGIKQGDVVVTSGQLKLKNGTPVNINNAVQPAFDPDPHPQEQ